MATLSEIEQFIITRIKELHAKGWTAEQIANALGTSLQFVQNALNAK